MTQYLVMRNVPDKEWSYLIGPERTIIGRSPSAQIHIASRFFRVSRRHAEVWADADGVWLRDLESRAGTRVNGVWVDHLPQARLIGGDSLSIADVELALLSRVETLATVRSPADDGDDETPDPYSRNPMSRETCRGLSPTEIDVLLWFSRGYHADDEIGELMFLSPHTIHNHVTRIMAKLGAHSRSGLMGWLTMNRAIEWPAEKPGGRGCLLYTSPSPRD